MSNELPVALITGASRRVGREIALALAEDGHAVAVHHRGGPRTSEEAEEVLSAVGARGGVGAAFTGDLADPTQILRLADEVLAWRGRLDVLVHNASTFVRLPFLGGDDGAWDEAWRSSLDVNLLAPARLSRALASRMADGGVIVHLVDIAAQQAWPHYSHYGVAKAGLAWLTRTLAVALAPRLRCVGVAPGIAVFPEHLDETARARMLARVPAGAPGTPADIAGAVRYLVGARYVTGVVLPVDGGRLAASGGEP